MAHRLALEAEVDLDELWFYIAGNSSVDVADRLVESLTTRFFLLASYPRAGRRCDGLWPGLRIFPVGDYVVLYRIDDSDNVVIVRVVRGSRDLETLFDE